MFLLRFFVLFLLLLMSSYTAKSESAIGNTCEEVSSEIKELRSKVDEIHAFLQAQATERNKDEHWEGNQSTLGSFKRLSNEGKRKLISFKLMNTENLNISLLIEELRPCSNLESIKLNHVELIGTFPNTSAGRLTFPKLHEFELQLDRYPAIARGTVLPLAIIFVQKNSNDEELSLEKISSWKTDFKIQIIGHKLFSIDHDFGEMVLDIAPKNDAVLQGINPNVFSLKKLTVSGGDLDVSDIPADLTYLNLKYVSLGKFRPTTEYMEVLNKTRHLRSLHIDNSASLMSIRNYAALLDFSELPYGLERISLRSMLINMTSSTSLPNLASLLLDGCQMDNSVIETIKESCYNLEKVAVMFDTDRISITQCHRLLLDLVKPPSSYSRANDLKRLTTISITSCRRKFLADFKPEAYDEVEEFLTNLGLGDSENFQLEKVVTNENASVWKGKNLTANEKMRIKYDYSDWYKIYTWKHYNEN